jgi:hypothetical protein
MTNTPTPMRWTMADLHNMARGQTDKVSALTRAALAMARAGECPDCITATIDAADEALDHLEAVNIDIENRLLDAIKRARRKATGKPTRSRQAKRRRPRRQQPQPPPRTSCPSRGAIARTTRSARCDA